MPYLCMKRTRIGGSDYIPGQLIEDGIVDPSRVSALVAQGRISIAENAAPDASASGEPDATADQSDAQAPDDHSDVKEPEAASERTDAPTEAQALDAPTEEAEEPKPKGKRKSGEGK